MNLREKWFQMQIFTKKSLAHSIAISDQSWLALIAVFQTAQHRHITD